MKTILTSNLIAKGGLLLALLLLQIHFLIGQSYDTLNSPALGLVQDQLENMAQRTDLNLDYSDLVEEYLYYYKHPINLNSKDTEKLVDLYLLNDNQLVNIRSYLSKYQQFLSVYELQHIPGIDERTLANLLPFVTILPATSTRVNKKKRIFRNGRHRLILRYTQLLETSAGYVRDKDSATSFPGSTFLGSPQNYYLRYGYNYKNTIRFGFTLEKDAGEVLFSSQLPDSVRILVSKQITNFSDFYSAHFYAADLGIVKKVIVGDYHLEFGQGLTMWSGLAFGKSADAIHMKRYGRGIRPNTSSNENLFLRGGAVSLGKYGISLTGFYSINNIDASIKSGIDGTNNLIGSFQTTGRHRTINELLTKDAAQIQVFGGRISYKHRFFKLGLTALQTKLSAGIKTGEQLYQQLNFNQKNLTNFGVDFTFSFQKAHIFGELATSYPGGVAGIIGINTFLHERFTFTVLYHNYQTDYYNLFANPFTVSSTASNEEGFYLGFRALLSKHLSLSGYIDHFRFPWLRYRTKSPSIGRDYLLQLNYTLSRNADLYLRYRYRLKEENKSGTDDYVDYIQTIQRNELRFSIKYKISKSIVFKNRIDYILYKELAGESKPGYMIYQDILYRPLEFPLEITFRYALFDTKGYDSRVYSYENDVLYAFSVPAYFDKGHRFYLMIRYKALKQLDLWLRISRTLFDNKNSIGSGADKIEGNKRTDVKVQLLLKL